MCALAHLELGRSYATRDGAKANTNYQNSLTLWKNADIPVLNDAKAEYAKLQ